MARDAHANERVRIFMSKEFSLQRVLPSALKSSLRSLRRVVEFFVNLNRAALSLSLAQIKWNIQN